jgi:hypothetical protein
MSTYNFMFTDMVGAKVGLALSQALIVTGMLQHGLQRATEVVSLMTSVERVLDYTNVEKEPELESAPGKEKTTADTVLLLVARNLVQFYLAKSYFSE